MSLACRLFAATLLCWSTAQAQNLIQNPGFETGLAPWSSLGDAVLTQTADPRHSGDFSARIGNRSATWQGPVQGVQGALLPGTAYRVSAWVRVGGGTPQPVELVFVQTDERGDVYRTAARTTAYPDRWVQAGDVYRHAEDNGPVSRLDFFVQGPAAGVDLLVDDVEIVALPDDWQTAANTRIDELRKRDLRVRVSDANGAPVAGATVTLAQSARAFPIGTAIAWPAFDTVPEYREYVLDHFNWAVHENEAKWYANEAQRDVVTYAQADAILDFADLYGLPMRGHTIFWAPERWQPAWVPDLDDAELELEVEERLEDVVSHFQGRLRHWDVNNEMLHGSFFEDRLGPDIRRWMFERTRAIDPDVQLFVNDYNIISGTEADAYVQQIQGFLDQGVPLDGIGVQGHFRAVDPWAVQLRLDKLAPFGLPIWVTELDVELADEEARADGLEAVLRTAFGHPSVEGVTLWGFWAGAHWRGPDAALVNLDWSLTAAGRRFDELLAEWTSEETRQSNANGVARARVFHGTYRVEVAVPGHPETVAFAEVVPGGGEQALNLQLDYAVDDGFTINAGHAGAWYNPATAGQGLFIDVEPASRFLFLAWFTYTDDGSDHPREQRWLTAQGEYAGDTAMLDLHESLGGQFDDPQAVTTAAVGQVTLTFADCASGQLAYRIDGEELEGDFPITRVIPGSEATCAQLEAEQPQAVAINAGMDGAWYDPAAPGQGFFVDAHPDTQDDDSGGDPGGDSGDDFIFVSWFTFGDATASGQRWLTAQGGFADAVAEIEVHETTGGRFAAPGETVTVPAGTLRLSFDDCNSAVFSYSLPDAGAEGDIAVMRVVPGGGALCEAQDAAN